MKSVSFSATLALLIKFLKVIKDLDLFLKDLIEDLDSSSKDLSSSLVELIEGLSSIEVVEDLKVLSLEASPEASLETSSDSEALIPDSINLL